MLQKLVVPIAFLASVLAAIVLIVGVLYSAPSASALPPAGVDALNATGTVSVTSRLGQEAIPVSGLVTISRGDPHPDGGVEVVDTEIIGLNLTGASVTGPVTITESPVLNSIGQIRSLQPSQQFPASSFFDIFIDAVIPGSGSLTPASLYNSDPLHLTAGGDLSAWPPVGAVYAGEPLFNTDNDGDTQIDEDTADDDGDGAYNEDPPGGGNQDTDNQVDEDGPIGVDNDGDTLVDEDPRCIPLYPTLPAGICVTGVTITFGQPKTPEPTSTTCPVQVCGPTRTGTPGATSTPFATATASPPPGPEDPTFSVAPGGPSGFHPADLLALTAGTSTVGGNDFFANATTIATLPFQATQATAGATLEPGEPTSPASCILGGTGSKGSTVWYRFSPTVSGQYTVDTLGSNFDTVVVVYTGGAVNALTLVGCNDDSSSLQSLLTFTGNVGTTYRIQAGGYGGFTGQLSLNLNAGGGAGGNAPPYVRIPCNSLGLIADGCDAGGDGDQDDIDALSFGSDFGGAADGVFFSVAPGGLGLAGTGVAGQAACSPREPQADEFTSELDGDNALLFDGDGSAVGCPSGFSLHLTERPTSDDLDALNEQPPSFVDPDNDGIPNEAVLFALAAGSPTLASLGRSPADVLWTVGGFQPGLYASAGALGLIAGDAIDALCIEDDGTQTYNAQTDTLLFSLAQGSPTLAQIGAGPGDLLRPGPTVAVAHSALGLRATDDLDAAKCAGTPGPSTVTVPVGDIWFCGPSFANGVVCETKINVGDTVVWDFTGAVAPHTTTHCGSSCDNPTNSPLWDSGVISTTSADRTFEYTFTQPGTYPYLCEVHSAAQRGRIVVNGPAGNAGDVDCNGDVTSIDAVLVLQFGASLLLQLGCPQNADVNSDGQVDSLDALLILQYVARLLDSLPP